MNFTREPIIETVITPREGCKLVVRSSKGVSQEDYFVDAVEVVSFGHSFFFRSQERPKSFLVPVSDYEILELKETRMVLKNVTSDRSIKIGGGRETPPPRREAPPEPRPEAPQDETLAESRPAPQPDQRPMGKREGGGRRRRGRRGRDRGPSQQDSYRPDIREQQREMHEQQQREMEEDQREEAHRPPEDHLPDSGEAPHDNGEPQAKAPSFISKLFPPPPTLIKDSISRYKPSEPPQDSFTEEKESFEETIFEHPTDKEPEDDEEE
ncbi:MAG TPA: hypothetical protein VLF94_00590 [Chlamydiales bacterium]|nr:hypothetical protein [Chlamydiales bacterium]